MSPRRVDKDEYIHLNHRYSEHTFKASWLRPIYSSWSCVFKTSSRRFQEIFKTSSRRLAKTSCQDVFKTSSRHLAKTSSRHLQNVLQRCLQEVFKTYHQVKLFFLTSLWDVFTFQRCTAKDGYLQKDLPKSHFWEIYGQSAKFARVIKILVAAYRSVFRTWSKIYNGAFL